ncbi:hypothetical protein, partial [Phocaeicola faecicola]|uniref:hypothetical protein n=1 Tax=Phocaeicola faecicola TaxID=2739389 RepID=UPI001C63A263
FDSLRYKKLGKRASSDLVKLGLARFFLQTQKRPSQSILRQPLFLFLSILKRLNTGRATWFPKAPPPWMP